MKRTKPTEPSKESLRALPEVDLSRLQRGRRGKYAHLLTGTPARAVVIDDDVWEHFKDSKSINSALRMLVDLAKKAKIGSRPPRGRTRRAA